MFVPGCTAPLDHREVVRSVAPPTQALPTPAAVCIVSCERIADETIMNLSDARQNSKAGGQGPAPAVGPYSGHTVRPGHTNCLDRERMVPPARPSQDSQKGRESNLSVGSGNSDKTSRAETKGGFTPPAQYPCHCRKRHSRWLAVQVKIFTL